MPGKVMKIGTFSDWVGLFKEWREEIGVNHEDFKAFKFETIFGAIETEEISFGYYKGRPKWENLRQIPTQDRKSTRLNSSHRCISYAVFCLKKKKKKDK